VARLLIERGVPLVDTDVLAREVVEPGQPALEEIKGEFGGSVISDEGSLCREKLAAIVFSNPEALRKLERITHPRIRLLWQARIRIWKAENRPVGVVVIPLLFETSAQAELDAVICVACAAATQRRRLAQRGWAAEAIQSRLAAQWPVEKKMAHANYVVWSEGPLELLGDQLDRIAGLG